MCVAAKSLPITLQPHPLYLCLSALPALVPRPRCIQMQCLARGPHATRARPLAPGKFAKSLECCLAVSVVCIDTAAAAAAEKNLVLC